MLEYKKGKYSETIYSLYSKDGRFYYIKVSENKYYKY